VGIYTAGFTKKPDFWEIGELDNDRGLGQKNTDSSPEKKWKGTTEKYNQIAFGSGMYIMMIA
jgi:hypothetical protein